MADNERWGDRDRNWRNRSWQQGDGQSRGASGGDFGPGGRGGRGYSGPTSEERSRHADRGHEGPAGYNNSGPTQGGWEFGDDEQGGERGQGYDQYGYGRQDRGYSQQTYGERGRDPGVGSGRGESWSADREFGRGGGYGSGTSGSGQRWRGAEPGVGRSAQPRSQSSVGQADYGYGYRGRNEFEGRAEDVDAHRSWLERAGDRVADFFGAGDGATSHRGRGPKGYKRSDARIQEDISDRLTDDPWLDASNVEVEVKECEVILKGEVSSREDKRRAEDLAEAISGVRNVQNHLRVQDYGAQAGQSSTTGADAPMGASGVLHDQATGRDGDKDRKRPHAPDSTPGLNT